MNPHSSDEKFKEIATKEFARIKNYESQRDRYYFYRRMKALEAVLPPNKDSRILDFGGGSGLFSYMLIKKGYTNVYLVDISETQIRQAISK